MRLRHHARSARLPVVLAVATLVLAAASAQSGAVDPRALSGGAFTVPEPTRFAMTQPGGPLPAELQPAFFKGRALFRQSWIVAPAQDSQVDGLGPVFNRLGCVSCHLDNGRGRPPAGPDETMQAMLVRLSVPGRDAHGGPNPHPAYGDQLNEHGIPGVPGEGRAAFTWEESSVTLSDGEAVALRRPRLSFPELNFGPLGNDVLVSARVAPHIFGLGLLEAVKDETILSLADPDDRNGDGVRGRANQVWDASNKRKTVGRFGLKANAASLRDEITGSFTFDLGITTPLFPEENCRPVQTACRAAASGGHPEMTQEQIDAVIVYYSALGVPARRHLDDSRVQRGERLFAQAGCAACHSPTLRTGAHPQIPALGNQIIHPYTDLLIHDMGEELADGRPDFEASGREWRTTPLWGVGLAGTLNEHVNYLHDGRARTLTEAILWHGGEGDRSRKAFTALPKADRDALIAFLESL